MTEREAAVLGYLVKKGGSAGPTEIGLALGFPYDKASSAITGSLKRLVKLGLVKKTFINYNKVTYEAVRQ